MCTSTYQQIGAIADDSTGALDTGAQFACVGLSTSLILDLRIHCAAAVQVISTNSRERDREFAVESIRRAFRQLEGRQIYKKIDSSMRGHIGAEVNALLAVARKEKAILCPAVIEAGRKVRHGQLWIEDELLHHSAFSKDPGFPAKTSDLSSILDIPSSLVSLEHVHQGMPSLRAAIRQARERIVVVDACTLSDLDTIGESIVGEAWIPCGALGLARAWARALTGVSQVSPTLGTPKTRLPLLVAMGSMHHQSRLQIARLKDVLQLPSYVTTDHLHWDSLSNSMNGGLDIIVETPEQRTPPIGAQSGFPKILGQIVRHAISASKIGALVIIGGETLGGILDALAPSSIQIRGELEPGVPWGTLIGGISAGTTIITKAGGFGDRDVLVRILDWTKER